MASIVGMCNAALINLGADTIISLDDNTKQARFCSQRFEDIRDAVLRAHPWNCATARASLAPLVEVPAWGYGVQYQLPADALRALRLSDPDEPFRIEGRRLLCNVGGEIQLLYIRRVDDPNQFDALFREALAARLAMDLAHIVTQEGSTVDRMAALYEAKLREARGVDAQEGSAPEFAADEWLRARSAGIGNPYGADRDVIGGL